jgi:hypothetical protein
MGDDRRRRFAARLADPDHEVEVPEPASPSSARQAVRAATRAGDGEPAEAAALQERGHDGGIGST